MFAQCAVLGTMCCANKVVFPGLPPESLIMPSCNACLCVSVICRNSKLTFRLQDALGGGNSKLLVVACISTARQDLAGAQAGQGQGAC